MSEALPGEKAESADSGPAPAEDPPVHTADESPPEAVAGELPDEFPSEGSKLHAQLGPDGQPACQPCAWFYKEAGCHNGKACYYCHLCPQRELKNRKKQKIARIRSQELEEKANKIMSEGLQDEVTVTSDTPGGDNGDGDSAPSPQADSGPSPEEMAAPMGEPPSVGSKLHGMLGMDGLPACRPCAWFYNKSGCTNAKSCDYCHLCPRNEMKARKKQKIQLIRSKEFENRQGQPGLERTTTMPLPDQGAHAAQPKLCRAQTDPRLGRKSGGPGKATESGEVGSRLPPGLKLEYGPMFSSWTQPPPWAMDPYMAAAAAYGYNPNLSYPMMPPASGYQASPMAGMPLPPSMGSPMAPGTSPIGFSPPAPETPAVPAVAEVPMPPITEDESSIYRIRWAVDVSKLLQQDKVAVSPPFQVPTVAGVFRMTLLPKGGASFKSSKGKGIVLVKHEEEESQVGGPAAVTFQISVRSAEVEQTGGDQEPARGPVMHDFAKNSFCGLPKDQEEWDFGRVAGGAQTFTVCLEILASDGSAPSS